MYDIIEMIPGILGKSEQPSMVRMQIAAEYIEETYPLTEWTQVYTDGSAKMASGDGGGDIFIQRNGTTNKISAPTGKICTNFRAERDAIKTATEELNDFTQKTR